jgi:hypothetical protein
VSSTRSARHTALITAILACSASTAFAQAVRIVPATSVRGVSSASATIKIREATPADAAATTITDDDTGVVIDASEGAMLGQDAATTALALAQAQAQANAIPFTPDELIELKKIFESLEEPQQDEMRAFYADLAVDLDAILGITAAKSMQAQRAQMIAGAMRELDFTRKPEAVLAARAKLGFGQVAHPNPDTAQPMDLARWIHLQVMAGEWATFAQYISTRPLAESEPMYAAILQSMNRGDSGLLPEEVLAFAEASPSEFKPWQLTARARCCKRYAKALGSLEPPTRPRADAPSTSSQAAVCSPRRINFFHHSKTLAPQVMARFCLCTRATSLISQRKLAKVLKAKRFD